MSSNPTKSEATNAETTKNPKEGSDWLGGPQNGSEIPGESDYTKHRFNETPGNGGNGGNASGSGRGGNGDETSVGNAYWQFFSDPTIKAKIKTIVDQADIPKTVVGEDLSQAPLREVLSQNSGDQRNWVLTTAWLELVKGLSQVMNVPPCPTENSPKTLSAWLGDAGLGPWLSSPALYDEPIGNVIQWPLLGYTCPWFQPTWEVSAGL